MAIIGLLFLKLFDGIIIKIYYGSQIPVATEVFEL